jgi:hypothetical protein
MSWCFFVALWDRTGRLDRIVGLPQTSKKMLGTVAEMTRIAMQTWREQLPNLTSLVIAYVLMRP